MTIAFRQSAGVLILAVLAAIPAIARAQLPATAAGTPVFTRETIAVIAKSRRVVAAYSPSLGKWSRIELEEPLGPNVQLVVGYGLAAFQTSKAVYAYSSVTGAWGELPLSKPTSQQLTVHERMVVMSDGDLLCVFGQNATEWSAMNLDSGEIVRP